MFKDQFSIYIHFPWCLKKCYYCDFNSRVTKKIPTEAYVDAILKEFTASLALLKFYQKCNLISIFFGGGTPSLLPAKQVARILNKINEVFTFPPDLEITLELNPKAQEQACLENYKAAGISRISVGGQSFQDPKLLALGRLHRSQDLLDTVAKVLATNFSSFNLDLMYGLPGQTSMDAIADLKAALAFSPPHISWYQLTIEPRTLFAKRPPTLPDQEQIWEIFQAGKALLHKHNYHNYEISAFAQTGSYCRHNLHYWQFGDYLGLGPGAHSKFSEFSAGDHKTFQVLRFAQPENPQKYFANMQSLTSYPNDQMQLTKIFGKDLVFEFMLNNLRLQQGFTPQELLAKTGYKVEDLQKIFNTAVAKGLLQVTQQRIYPTELGFRFLNDLQELFLGY